MKIDLKSRCLVASAIYIAAQVVLSQPCQAKNSRETGRLVNMVLLSFRPDEKIRKELVVELASINIPLKIVNSETRDRSGLEVLSKSAIKGMTFAKISFVPDHYGEASISMPSLLNMRLK